MLDQFAMVWTAPRCALPPAWPLRPPCPPRRPAASRRHEGRRRRTSSVLALHRTPAWNPLYEFDKPCL